MNVKEAYEKIVTLETRLKSAKFLLGLLEEDVESVNLEIKNLGVTVLVKVNDRAKYKEYFRQSKNFVEADDHFQYHDSVLIKVY